MRSLGVLIPVAAIFLVAGRPELTVKAAKASAVSSAQETEVCELLKKGYGEFAASPFMDGAEYSVTVSKCSLVDIVPQTPGTSFWVKYTLNYRQVDNAGVVHNNDLDVAGLMFRDKDGHWTPFPIAK